MLNKKQKELFKIVANQLRRKGFEGRLVGGCVRDIYLGVEPNDIDICTNATPEEVISTFSRIYINGGFIRVIPTGIKHGTVTVVIDTIPIEITTLRIDQETDGRHAVVEYTNDWSEDALRRDFTMNAMSMDIEGNIYDYFEGKADLDKKIIRFVGDAEKRIDEDYLRILRYYRFILTYNLSGIEDINPIIERNIPNIENISGERIWSELVKILNSEYRHRIVEMPAVLLEYMGFRNIKNFDKFISMAKDKTFNAIHLMASLLDDIEDLNRFKDRLKIDNNTYNMLHFLIENKDRKLNEQDFKNLYVYHNINIDYIKHYAIYSSNLELLNYINEFSNNVKKLPVSGNDIKAAGYSGSDIGQKLKDLNIKFINSDFTLTKEQLLKE
jgi:tRNA nucleotidyltransferase/poly(A) polymerase